MKLRLKELSSQLAMNYIGFSPVERLTNAPRGRRPVDVLPGARSVVVMGIRIGEGVRYVQTRASDAMASGQSTSPVRYGAFVYQVYGYDLLNHRLNMAALEVSRMLEAAGHRTVPIPASAPYDVRERVGVFSHVHASVAAGLGEFGWNNLLLTPRDGPRVRLVSVITTAELEPDPMYEGPRLCDPGECETICVKVCPTAVLGQDEAVEVDIEGKVLRYGQIDRLNCLSAPCARCLVYCPVGGQVQDSS